MIEAAQISLIAKKKILKLTIEASLSPIQRFCAGLIPELGLALDLRLE